MVQSHPPFRTEQLSREEAASYLGVSARTLAVWKSTGRYNLPCVRIGRLAKYRKADLDDFIARHITGAECAQ